FLLIIGLAAAVLLGGIIFSVWLVLWIFDLPNKLGKQFNVDESFRRILYRVVNEDELEYFRDEFMAVVHTKAKYREGIERWGLRREIDLERERAIQDLRRGEQVIAILGGVLTIILGNFFGIAIAALALTVITVFYSIAVGFRVLVVDTLAYSGTPHKHTTLREL
ncbi:MAG: hypothetical protein ABEI86_07165, partial [Halobacteriaceae archaeon]